MSEHASAIEPLEVDGAPANTEYWLIKCTCGWTGGHAPKAGAEAAVAAHIASR